MVLKISVVLVTSSNRTFRYVDFDWLVDLGLHYPIFLFLAEESQ